MTKRAGWLLFSSRYFICLDADTKGPAAKFYFSIHVDGDKPPSGKKEEARWIIAEAICRNAKTQDEVFRIRRLPKRKFKTRDDALGAAWKELSLELNQLLRKVA